MYFLLTRWGRVGDGGQHQQSPCEGAVHAKGEFRKIFKSKAGNEWAACAAFEKKPDKYRYHAAAAAARRKPAEVLDARAWRDALVARGAATLAPPPLARLLLSAADFGSLAHALREQQVDAPLGRLARPRLADARAALDELATLLAAERAESAKRPRPDGDALQRGCSLRSEARGCRCRGETGGVQRHEDGVARRGGGHM